MANFLATFLGVLGALLAALISGVGLESYKRHCDKQGVASALAGEIFAIIQMSEKRNYVEYYKSVLKIIRDDKIDVKLPNIIGDTSSGLDPIFNNNIDKLGLLNATTKLPERIAIFYSYLQGIRLDLITLAKEDFSQDLLVKAEIIEEDLKLWAETVKIGNGIWNELTLISRTPWWLHSKCLNFTKKFTRPAQV